MAEYIYNKQLPNETTIKIESNNRELFIGIEESINKFISKFTNEKKLIIQNEEKSSNGIEKQTTVQNGNRFKKSTENGNEELDEFQIEKNDGNEEKSSKKPSKSILTKWGNAYLDRGYYKISSMEHRGEPLHKLIYEDYHKCTVIRGHIHHINGIKTDNNPENLILLSPSEHSKITRDMMKYGNRKEKPLIPKNDEYWNYSNKLSVERNTTGYLHVYKQVCPRCSQGFTWKYTWRENGKLKTLESTNIKKLEAKVIAKGLPWQKL